MKNRGGMGYLIAIISLVAVLMITLGAFQVARQEADRIQDHHLPAMHAASQLQAQLERLDNLEFLYLAAGSDAGQFMRQFDLTAEDLDRTYQRLAPAAAPPEVIDLYAEIGQRFGAFMHINGRMRALAGAGKWQEARDLNASESLRAEVAFRTAALRYSAMMVAGASRARATEERTMLAAELVAVAIAGLGALVAGVLWRREMAAWRSANELLNSEVAAATSGLRAANAKLEAMVAELQALDKLKSEFLAVTSHELLTPVAFILGFATSLEDGLMGELTPRQQEAVGKIVGGAERLTRMVRNTLEFSRAEAGQLPVYPGPVDVEAIAARAVAAHAEAAQRAGVTLVLAGPTGAPRAEADPDRVAQVADELLDNAIKFTPAGGEVRVGVDVADGRIVLEVADTGPGIPPFALERLPQPFFQADSTATRQHGGLGLGLALSYRIAHAMGGALAVRTRVGQGATFRLSLPPVGA